MAPNIITKQIFEMGHNVPSTSEVIHLTKLISTPVIVFRINYDMINANI
jgi:hypothetical protein